MSMIFCAALNTQVVPNRRFIVQPIENYTYAQLCEDLEALQTRYPDTLRVGSAGASREGRELFAAVAGAPGAKRHVLIQGSIHGREHMTALLAMMQLERLLYCGVPQGFNFHILPMTNPDGVSISQTGTGPFMVEAIYHSDVDAGYARPPKREALRDWKANAAGVDLNRNFDAGWERIDTRPAPSGANYRGPTPLSEPETRALVAYTQRFHFDVTLSYHATGSEIYFEYGANSPVNEAGLSLARAVNRCLRYALRPDSGVSSGGYKDWAIEKRGIPSLTIEIGKGDTPLSLREYRDIYTKNKDVPRAVAKWVDEYVG